MAKTKKLSAAKDKDGTASKARARADPTPRNHIRHWRLFRGLERQQDLAALTAAVDPKGKGIDRVSITRLENGDARYNEDHINIIAKALRVSARDLIGTNPLDAGDIFAVYADLNDQNKRQVKRLLETMSRRFRPS